MYDNQYPGYNPLEVDQTENSLYEHVAKTYLWMFGALLITFAVAVVMDFITVPYTYMGYVYSVPILAYASIVFPYFSFILLLAKFGLVLFLSARFHSFSVGTVRTIFLVYSALTGITFSAIFWVYASADIMILFLVTALFFGAMAGVGLLTKKDLSGFRSTVLFGLVALLIMHFVGAFFHLELIEIATCFFGIILFMGITIYDAKKTKDFYYECQHDAALLKKASIYSALQLYLDFINIFLYLLRLFGRRR